MQLWHWWTQDLGNFLNYLISHFALSEAAGIILLSLLIRLALFPLSLAAARNMQKNKAIMEELKPEMERLKAGLQDQPAELARQTMALYRQRGVQLLGKASLLNLTAQSTLGLGFLQALKASAFHSALLWIADLGKPDILLSILTGTLLFFSMQLMPGGAEQHSMLLIMLPVLVSSLVLLSLPSSVGLYWLTSNAFGIAQSLILRRMATQRFARRSGQQHGGKR